MLYPVAKMGTDQVWNNRIQDILFQDQKTSLRSGDFRSPWIFFEGGAMRSVFAAGVLDFLMEKKTGNY